MGASWTIINVGGGSSPLIIHVPHSGTWIPESERSDLQLDDADLADELARMTDWFTDRIGLDALARADVSASVFVNKASRLLVDPERFLGEDEPMRAVGMGPVYLATSDQRLLRKKDPIRDDRLINQWFRPYAAAFADLVDQTLATHGRAVIIDLHSFPCRALPYELDPIAERPGICIGTDPFHTTGELESAAYEAFGADDWDVGTNTPFAGTYVPLAHLGCTRSLHSLMIEIRRDLYQVEPGGPCHAGYERIVDHLAAFTHAILESGNTSHDLPRSAEREWDTTAASDHSRTDSGNSR